MIRIIKVLILSVFAVAFFSILESCNKSDDHFINKDITYGYEGRLKKVTAAEIPAGMVPKEIHSRAELVQFINELDNLKINVKYSYLRNGYSPIIMYNGNFEKPIKSNLISNTIRFKSAGEAGPGIATQIHTCGLVDVWVCVAYTKPGENLTVTSEQLTVDDMFEWKEVGGVAAYLAPENRYINYACAGIVITYVKLLNGDRFEVHRSTYNWGGQVGPV